MVVKLTVHDFQTADFGSCTSDLLTLYDSFSSDNEFYIGTFCGSFISSVFQSTSSNLFLELKTDSSFRGKGLNASFEFTGELIFLH